MWRQELDVRTDDMALEINRTSKGGGGLSLALHVAFSQ